MPNPTKRSRKPLHPQRRILSSDELLLGAAVGGRDRSWWAEQCAIQLAGIREAIERRNAFTPMTMPELMSRIRTTAPSLGSLIQQAAGVTKRRGN